MEISKVSIKNILGIDNLEFKAGKFNIISGKNGQGKTSIIEGIKAALNGKAANATLVRQGAENGEVVLLLNDGTEIRRSINGESKLDVRSINGKVGKPQTFLDNLYDIMQVNPIEFITADKKKRTSILLEAIPMTLTEEQLEQALNGLVKFGKEVTGKHALEAIEQVRKTAYDERTIENRFLKEKSNTIIQMRQTLPQDLDPSINIDEELVKHEQTRFKMEVKRNEYFAQFEKERDELRALADAEYERMVAEARKRKDEAYSKAESECNDKKAEKQQAFEAKYNPLLEEIGKLRNATKHIAAVKETQKMIDKLGNECDIHKNKSERLSEALTNLENLKVSLLKELPIKGLEVIDGEIYRNGILFDRLNTAQQIQIAFEIAKLRAGDLKMICIDGLERLDENTFNEFKKQAEESELQVIVTKVTNDKLEISNG